MAAIKVQTPEVRVSFTSLGPLRFHRPSAVISTHNRVVYRCELDAEHFVVTDEVLNDPQRESAHPDGLLTRTLHFVSGIRNFLLRTPAKNPQKWDIVLLGKL